MCLPGMFKVLKSYFASRLLTFNFSVSVIIMLRCLNCSEHCIYLSNVLMLEWMLGMLCSTTGPEYFSMCMCIRDLKGV